MRLIALTFFFAVAPTSLADVFCVNDSLELESALASVGNNGVADEIRIRQGDYPAPPSGFGVTLSDDQGLRISGGWRGAIMNDCAIRDAGALSTRLSGNGQSDVLSISPGVSADVTVSRIHFTDGMSTTRGAGLSVFGAAGFVGDIVVEGNIFSGNVSTASGAGLAIACDGGTCVVRNNLFYANEANVFSAFELVGNGPGETFVTNNTVVYNLQIATGSGTVIMTGSADKLIANNLFWGNDAQDIAFVAADNATYLFTSNNFESFAPLPGNDGGGNLSIDPGFLLPPEPITPRPTTFDLSAGSPMVDIGTMPEPSAGWTLGDVDIVIGPRVLDGAVDIGAFEGPGYIFQDGFEALD